jgi:predicted HTH transcriptional regulator
MGTYCVTRGDLNALVHNDFANEVPPKFEFFKDRIEITSTGGLPQGLSQEEFFEGYSVPRNKEIMRIFRDLRLVEQLGSGVPRILQTYSYECFRFSENFVRMTFPISNKLTSEIEKNSKLVEGLVEGLVERLVEGLVENQKKMVYLIDQNPTITIKELAESIGISTTAIDKNLTKLKDKNILRRIGGDKKGRWELVKNN